MDGGAIVRVFDPTISVPDDQKSAPDRRARRACRSDGEGLGLATSVRVYPDAYAACEGASATVVLTEWDQFRWLDFARVR